MPYHAIATLQRDERHSTSRTCEQGRASSATLPLAITKAASKQTYYTIRFLVDRDRMLDAYRAYAYFRWLDDRLDREISDRSERLALVERQQSLIDDGYHSAWPPDLTAEERMVIDLIRGDREPNSGLRAYIRNMMAVMAFDADRRGRLISDWELAQYTHDLSVAVTEALHYFIGHTHPPPQSDARYLPALAAHITHMLRDTIDDVADGYFNIPREYLDAQGIEPWDVQSDPYRGWVKRQVRTARAYFEEGEAYLARVQTLRCRIAGAAYMARFTGVLDAIEREEYRLRPQYSECRSVGAELRRSWTVFADTLGIAATSYRARP